MPKYKQPKLLVVGSLVMDLITTTGRVPETGETVIGTTFQQATGGKGANQALQARRLGSEVTMVGCVGDDGFGQALTESLRREGVDVSHIRAAQKASSAVGNVILAKTQDDTINNRIIVAPGANMQLTEADVAFLKDEIGFYDMVLLQLEIPMEVNRAVLNYAKAKGVPVMLNPAPYAAIPEEMLSAVDYLSPNETEAARLLGFVPGLEENGIVQADCARIQAYLKANGLKKLLLTLGGHGAACITETECIYCPSVHGVTPVDPTAAGDSFVGAFCTAHSIGYSDYDAMQIANHTAAITVCGMGAQPSLPALTDVLNSILQKQVALDVAPLQAMLPATGSGLCADKRRTAFDVFQQSAGKEVAASIQGLEYERLNQAAVMILDAMRLGSRLHISGIGKPAHIAGYAASLFSSVGTPAYFLHGTEAVHGSCGQLKAGDVVIFISNSGETMEMKAAVNAIRNNGCKVIGISGNGKSWLAEQSDLHLAAHVDGEGGPLNRAPRNSILAETIVLQALSVLLQAEIGWDAKEYVKRHPGGALGKL